jgi:hypothetical protein
MPGLDTMLDLIPGKRYATLSTIYFLAAEIGKAKKSGDLQSIAAAEQAHRKYEQYCLRSDVEILDI